MYLAIFRKLLKSLPNYRFPEHAVVICDNGRAHFYSDTILCKFFLPEIRGQGVFPGDQLRTLKLRPPYECQAHPDTKGSQINAFKFYNVPYPSGNRVNALWQRLSDTSTVEITFDMNPQQWRSLLVSVHEKHPIYKNFHLNFETRAIETLAEARACKIEDGIKNIKNFTWGDTKMQRSKLQIDWRTEEETSITEEVDVTGALIPQDFMHVMMLDHFQGTLRYDYQNELLEYRSFKHYPSLFDRAPRHFHAQTRTKAKSFPDLRRLATWDRSAYSNFIFLCQKCLRSLRDQIRPYIDSRFRETITFSPLPERGMRFEVCPTMATHPMEFSLPNEQHNFDPSACNKPVLKFDPYYLFDLLAFDGDMTLRLNGPRDPVMVEVESIRLKHVVMPRT